MKYEIKNTSNKSLISKLLREAVELSTTDETTDSETYNIMRNNRVVGNITCGPSSQNFGDETLEIIDLQLEEGHETINVGNEGVKQLFKIYPEINRLIVSLPPESRLFWEKIGFNRLNDVYHILFRGH